MPKQLTPKMKIVETPNVIDDHFLDIIGNDFQFDHEKGLAEWLKNSVDAYRRIDIPDNDQNIIIKFIDGENNKSVFECIDFVGMNKNDIESAFKRWGDPDAAKRGKNKRFYGGHGNGGKFYMRQMFNHSAFITYKGGYLNIFGFNENRKYGFAEGFNNKKTNSDEAIKIAGIENLNFPLSIKKSILDGKTGFTVIRGIGPKGMRNKIKVDKIVEKIKIHPQSRRILSHANVLLAINSNREYAVLKPEDPKPLSGFEIPKIFEIPKVLSLFDGKEEILVEMASKKYESGKLILKTSEESFGKGSKIADLNRIDILGEIGVVGSYQLYKLGVTKFPQASFIYGDCKCPILEDPEMDSVKNDRTELVENDRSKALLIWIRNCVNEYADEITEKERSDQEEHGKKISAAFNEYLNHWKDQFMSKLSGSLYVTGDDNGHNGDKPFHRNVLAIPKNGLEFSYPVAEIGINREEKITLKALVPNPIPVGGIIKIKSTNSFIETTKNELAVKIDMLRVVPSGETVAVFNIPVIGHRIGEKGELLASFGKHKSQISISVIDISSEENKKKSKYPRILLSGIDLDPLNLESGSIILTERDPVVYQRYQDVSEGIYWINTKSSLASAIIDNYGDHSIHWRNFLFQRYVDIFVKQMIYKLQKDDFENFRAERVDSELDSLITKIHSSALNDLGKFFFEEEFEPMGAENENQ